MTYFTIAGPVSMRTNEAQGFAHASGDQNVQCAIQSLAQAVATIAEAVDNLGKEVARLG
jgi:hypothetical protein